MRFEEFAIKVMDTITGSKNLFRTDVSGDHLWEVYLASFPEGSNPIYCVRTFHDGSYDKNFIRQLGGLVTISEDGAIKSIWDIEGLAEPYAMVAAALAVRVRMATITGPFYTKEIQFGHKPNTELLDNGDTTIHDHFLVRTPSHYLSNAPEQKAGELRTARDVFWRGLTTISTEALETVITLIDEGNLYRGTEFLPRLRTFLKTLRDFQQVPEHLLTGWGWIQSPDDFRNTVIGTLVVDISEGMDVGQAVRMFEAKVAPANYKRPKAIVTQKMVDSALQTIQDLGIERSLERRHARITDLSIRDVLWVSNESAKQLRSSVAKLLDDSVTTLVQPAPKNTTKIALADFVGTVLPKAKTVELHVTGSMTNRMVSLTSPVHPEEPELFKWPGSVGWSYNGDVTDSIREKVRKAGGRVTAKHRVSLAWFNTDDLDLHCYTPTSDHIYHGNKMGILDVDMNVGASTASKTPVENMSFNRLNDGVYTFGVRQFTQRNTHDVGFILEVESDGVLRVFSFPGLVSGEIPALEFEVSGGIIKNVAASRGMTEEGRAQDLWGITTENFVPVRTLLHSPNHWDGTAIGHQHLFFILEGCRNPEPVRCIYNEFLSPVVYEHRRVFEVLGGKTKAPYSDDQLSGVGFSTDVRTTAMVRVDGRIYEVSI